MSISASGAVSLDTIHTEAGGSSGTTCSLGDSDIRAIIGNSSGANNMNAYRGHDNELTLSCGQDTVTVSLRTVSVLTGRILTEVTTTKSILSVGINEDVFRFVFNQTELVEIENGNVENESITIALQSAIEMAVLKTVEKGIIKNYWSYKDD